MEGKELMVRERGQMGRLLRPMTITRVSKQLFWADEHGLPHNFRYFGLAGEADEKDHGTGGDAPGRLISNPR